MNSESGKIILIVGTSSAGKSTLARALKARLEEPFCYYSSGQLAERGFRVRPSLDFREEPNERERFFNGFHRSIAAFAAAGNNLIVEHIIEERMWRSQLLELLCPFDTYWVGLHAPLEVLEARERTRADRAPGEAKQHLRTFGYCRYDLALDTSISMEENLDTLLEHWRAHVDMQML